jgi:hypothetical protein
MKLKKRFYNFHNFTAQNPAIQINTDNFHPCSPTLAWPPKGEWSYLNSQLQKKPLAAISTVRNANGPRDKYSVEKN